MRSIASLTPFARNSRTHSEGQIAQIAASIREFGWTNPLLIGDDGGVIAGHGRLLAAKLLGEAKVPCIVLTGLTAAQRRALVIADNKLALNAGWDDDLLAAELKGLGEEGFDLSLIGFDELELVSFLRDGGGQSDPDDVPEAPAVPVSQLGDVWVLGAHRLVCGDSTDAETVAAAIGGLKVDLACSDPPYGIEIVKGSSVGGSKAFGSIGGHQHKPKNRLGDKVILAGTYAAIIGDDTTETAVAHAALLAEIGVPVVVLWGGNYFANDLPPSRCWLVWDKENTGSFADVELAWTNQDKVARLFKHQWSGLIKASERGERRVHPTQKPVALAEWVIDTLAPKATVIFDGFLGSGWTLIAAERKDITCVALELSPAYVDVAIERWQTYTGQQATREDGTPFDALKALANAE